MRPRRPKNKWANGALIELWDEIKEQQPSHRTEFDSKNTDIQNIIKKYVKDIQIHRRSEYYNRATPRRSYVGATP